MFDKRFFSISLALAAPRRYYAVQNFDKAHMQLEIKYVVD